MSSYNDTYPVTKGSQSVSMATHRIRDPEELQRVANSTLREAMINERSKRWLKVVHNYKHLLRLLTKKNLPPNLVMPSWYSMLLYEVYYHLGIALQHIGEHRKAVQQYTKAIEAVFVPKNGCQAGCNSNSCLMTPLYARRAFAYSKSGDSKNALKDAEKAVVLDNKNPDVYCIRALVRGTRNETALALQDSKVSLKYNPSHLCGLILKGRLEEPQVYDEWLDPGKKSENKDHKKLPPKPSEQHEHGVCQSEACSINPDCHNFLTVQNFNHPEIQPFYERFLYSLSVPHTVCEVTFPHKGHGQHSRASSAKSTDSRLHDMSEPHNPTNPGRSFRCGTPGVGVTPEQHDGATRRRMYGEAVREHAARPKTADQFMAHMEKQRLKKHLADARETRLKKSPSLDNFQVRSRVGKLAATATSPAPGRPQVKKPMVFQETNIKNAPRMYYRPWLGDKLPVAEVERKQWITPPFK